MGMVFGTISGISKPVARLVQGTVPLSSQEEERSLALLDGVIECGGNTFDTAHGYGGGDPERLFGRWLKERGNRESVVILSKGAHHNQDRRRVTPYDIESDLHDSLARMQVEYVDLYLLHRDDENVPVGPIVEVLNRLKLEGLIRAFGGSNWSHKRIADANEYANANGLTPFAVSSPNFSLAEQHKEPWDNCVSITGDIHHDARLWYRESQFPVFSWSSLGGGFFSGKISRDKLVFDDYYLKLAVECYVSDANFARLDRAAEIGKSHGLSAIQVALAWIMSQGINLFPLVGCHTAEEYRNLADAIDIRLSEDECSYLNLKSNG